MTDVDMNAAYNIPIRGDQLFMIFSRFEYALKKINYARLSSNRAGTVEVMWDKFVDEQLGPAFFARVRAENIAPTIISQPPSKQIINGGLQWEAGAVVRNERDLFVMVRRVRNNLFHGGKSGDPDSDRNTQLIAESISVLIAALEASPDLRTAFENRF